MKIVFSPRSKILAALSLAVVGALIVIGWSASAAQQASRQRPYLPLSMSINRLMDAVVEDAAHTIWNGGNAKKPLNAGQWQTIDEHVYQLQAAATLVSLGGTGKADAGWTASPAFQDWARKLNEAAITARHAVEKKDQKALFAAGNTIVETCDGCHKQFKPDLPTEGILHKPHYNECSGTFGPD
jgi:hypothetical protein